jgi:uncharacterized protein
MKPRDSKYYILFFFILSIFISENAVAQFSIPERPSDSKQHFVYDYIDLLTSAQQQSLETKLTNYADSTSTQIVIAIISSTKGEDISFLGAKWGQQWGIGQANSDNGILILLAKDDRTVDINTGYGIEYRVTDRMAEQVINRAMIPQFKKGDFYNGLNDATDLLIAMLSGEFKASEKTDFPYGILVIIAVFLLFLVIMVSASRKGGGGKGGKGHGTGSLWDIIILSNAGRTGGGWSSGGSFGSGGFGGGGFGGGGFGGGGASGSW